VKQKIGMDLLITDDVTTNNRSDNYHSIR